jgi:DNA-binding NarL/FixJ family response regulator
MNITYRAEQTLQDAVKSAVTAIASKATNGNDSLQSIRETRKGSAFHNPRFSEVRLAAPARKNHIRDATLTSRQTEVLRFIADGYLTRHIAGFLKLSPKTVEKHRQGLMNKLNIHNIAILTRYAVSKGIVSANLRY